MKIHSIKYDTKSGFPSGPSGFKVGMQEDSIVAQGYNADLDGSRASKSTSKAAVSFTGGVAKLEKFGEKFFDKIARSEALENVLGYFNDKPVVAQSLIALGVAGILRPATNIAMAGKDDREDSLYAASHAISSAVIGFLASSVLMAPFNAAAKKIDKDPAKYLKGAEKNLNVAEIGARKLGKSKEYKNLSQFAKMLPDSIVFGVAKAMLTIALIPPILKYAFHVEKKSKTKPQTVAPKANIDFCDKPVFQQFKGGLK